jgi:glucan phosphoethanolaminetransferase (alkaline phosphatase superfamily)
MPSRIRGHLAAALFPAQFVLLDLCLRGPHAVFASPRAALSALQSVALGYLLWTCRARAPARVLLALVTATLVAVECLFFRYYHAPLDAQVIASALHNWADVWPVAVRMVPQTIALALAIGAAEYALLASRAPARAQRRLPAAAVLALATMFAPPLRDATPELRLADAARLLWTPAEASAATSVRVPVLPSTRKALPNVLLIVTESVRADDYCSAHPSADGERPACDIAPEVDALLPDRIPLRQMRSVASYTAVSLSALITGHTQEGSRRQIVEAPTVFDLVRAVRAGGVAPSVAYWSAQSEGVFERSDIRGAVDSFVTLETLLGQAVDDEDRFIDRGVDRLLAAHFVASIGALAAPSFTFLHFAGTHAPYFVDPKDAPFQPWRREVTWAGLGELHNAYKDAIHEQDKSVAACIRAFLARSAGAPWVILFTSDHGEAFGEHGAIHHGQSLYDEQVHVPGWIAFGGGALDAAEESNLRAYADSPVTHLDLLPTLLDLYGVQGGFAMAPYRTGLGGRSLIAPKTAMSAAVPITNCTAMFPCPINAWGMLRDGHALQAQPWDDDWTCVASGARLDATDPVCGALREASKSYFPTLPNRRPNL